MSRQYAETTLEVLASAFEVLGEQFDEPTMTKLRELCRAGNLSDLVELEEALAPSLKEKAE